MICLISLQILSFVIINKFRATEAVGMAESSKNIAIHFPYSPKYIADFLKALQNASVHKYAILTDTASSDGIEFDKSLSAFNVVNAPIIKFKGLWYSTSFRVKY